jgi:hypothetical protein
MEFQNSILKKRTEHEATIDLHDSCEMLEEIAQEVDFAEKKHFGDGAEPADFAQPICLIPNFLSEADLAEFFYAY